MKTDTHPTYNDTTVRCSCGNTFITRSTRAGDLQVELCNECHPFFTGTQKLVDTGGRVEKIGDAGIRPPAAAPVLPNQLFASRAQVGLPPDGRIRV